MGSFLRMKRVDLTRLTCGSLLVDRLNLHVGDCKVAVCSDSIENVGI